MLTPIPYISSRSRPRLANIFVAVCDLRGVCHYFQCWKRQLEHLDLLIFSTIGYTVGAENNIILMHEYLRMDPHYVGRCYIEAMTTALLEELTC